MLRSVAGNDIATSLECTETEAKTFLDQFLSSASQQIDADSYDLRMQISICIMMLISVAVDSCFMLLSVVMCCFF